MKLKIFAFLAIIICSNNFLNAEETNKEISFYTGTFDIIDKEGDDQTNLFGVEHKNPELFRNTFLGKFSPVTVHCTPVRFPLKISIWRCCTSGIL